MDEFLTTAWSFILILGIIVFLLYPFLQKKRVSNNNVIDEAERKKEELKRKDKIIKRVFSYQYEELIYEIFSPYAKKNQFGGTFRRQSWSVNEELENEFVINEISRILSISYDEASSLFKKFIENELLGRSTYKNRCNIGTLLGNEWDLVSKDDMNLSRWMESHHNIESIESADKRRKPYSLCSFYRFRDFVDAHGNYKVTITNTYSKSRDTFWIVFPDNVKVLLSLCSLGILIENRYKKREDEVYSEIYSKLWELPNLFVMVDDGHYRLVLEEKINWSTNKLLR